jgi:beta-glucosidase-like glycosyl hydrolase
MIERLFNSVRVALAICALTPAALAGTAALTPEQKAGQFLGTTLAGLSRDEELDLWLGERAVGLLVLYRDAMHPVENHRIRQAAERHARTGLRPILATDQEGGFVVRYDAAALPSPMALGATGSETLAFRAGRFTACSLKTMGVDANFAPVLDLGSPAESGIGTRSFGGDAASVGRLGVAYIRGLSGAGVLAIGKHFPGQGFADADPHFALSRSPRTAGQMWKEDLRPFAEAIRAGLDGVMTAHVSYPAWAERGEVPASLSREILTTTLRGRLGFEGLVVTDAIQMGGLGRDPDAGELAVRAIEAGADIILAPAPLERERVYEAVLGAVRSGRIPEERIARTLARLRRARERSGGTGACESVASPAEEIAHAAVTRIGGAPPLDPDGGFYVGGAGDIADRFPATRRRLLGANPSADERAIESVVGEILDCGPTRWVASIQNRSQAALVAAVRERIPHVPLTLVVLGSPHDAAGIEADDYVFTYGAGQSSIEATLEVLNGSGVAPGRLPVDVAGVGTAGEGATDYAVSSGARESR